MGLDAYLASANSSIGWEGGGGGDMRRWQQAGRRALSVPGGTVPWGRTTLPGLPPGFLLHVLLLLGVLMGPRSLSSSRLWPLEQPRDSRLALSSAVGGAPQHSTEMLALCRFKTLQQIYTAGMHHPATSDELLLALQVGTTALV